jgi:uncharacterized protein YkwD
MQLWHGLMLGLVWLGVASACTACKPTETQAAVVASAASLSPLEKDLVQEINLARTQPQAYAAFLEQLRPNYRGGRGQGSGQRTTVTQDGNTALITAEGPKALDEAIAFLRSTSPLPPLEVSKGMSLGARDHVKEQVSTGTIGHQGRSGSQPGDRVNRYGRWQGTLSENIAFGMDSARSMTVALIIDDGVPSRGHRKNIFDARARVMGVACGSHRAGQNLCVTTFAASYKES